MLRKIFAGYAAPELQKNIKTTLVFFLRVYYIITYTEIIPEEPLQKMIKKQSATKKNEETEFKVRWILYFCLALTAVLAVLSYSPDDISIIRGGSTDSPKNWIGTLGAYVSCSMMLLFGLATYFIVFFALLRSVRIFLGNEPGRSSFFWLSLAMISCGLMLLFAFDPRSVAGVLEALNLGSRLRPGDSIPGGVLGQFFAAPGGVSSAGAGWMVRCIGKVGVVISGSGLIAAGVALCYINDWHILLKKYVFAAKDTSGKKDALAALTSGKNAEEEEEEEEEEELFEDDELAEESAADLKQPEDSGSKENHRKKTAKTAEAKNTPATLLEHYLANDGVVAGGDDAAEAAFVPGRGAVDDSEEVDDALDLVASLDGAPAPVSAGTAAIPAPRNRNPEPGKHIISAGEKLRGAHGDYVVPPITMLSKGKEAMGESDAAIELAQARLQETLDSFEVPGVVSGYVTGPRVTRFEITLKPGVNVKKVEQIADNIAMNLAATSVRILAPIPGRTVVGVEVSNSHAEAVHMRSVMESDAWLSSKAEIPIALGKNVSGEPVVMDLAKAPHMLVAGSTGTGKSVCSNSLIISLLCRFSPQDLRLIMVDPKIVEFDAYKTLPHLLTPIITDPAKVPIALRWAAAEMDKRYRILARVGVKKLAEFNHRQHPETPEYDDDGKEIPATMPLLVIIIDELADLMMTEAKKDVETNITRIAQKGRAAGIHIIVATQRPSTNIITGVIKANLPTRLCFQVRSNVDSRVVLDTVGAEKLLGMGDMLFMSSGSMNIERVQGAWVQDDDIKSIVKFISEQAPQNFNANVVADNEAADAEIDEEYEAIDPEDRQDIASLVKKYMRPEDDDIIRKALEVVILDRKASTSYLQRRLRIGDNKAAEVVDILEARGILGPPSGSGNKRDILIFDGADIG